MDLSGGMDLLLKTPHKIICIYSQPPKKSNRGQKINSSVIQSFAESKKLKVFTPVSLETESEYEKLKEKIGSKKKHDKPAYSEFVRKARKK